MGDGHRRAVQVLTQRQGEAPQPELGGVVHPGFRCGAHPGHRPNEHHRPRRRRCQVVLHERHGQLDGGPQVGVDDGVDLIGGHIGHRSVGAHPGIEHQTVQRAHHRGQVLHLTAVTEVGHHHLRPDFGGQGLKCSPVATRHDQLGAAASKGSHHGRTQSPCRSGDGDPGSSDVHDGSSTRSTPASGSGAPGV